MEGTARQIPFRVMKKYIIYSFIYLFFTSVAYSKTIVVSEKGSIKSVKTALKIAGSGDTILVAKGIYRESGIVIDKRIILKGRPGACLVSSAKEDMITVKTDSVFITGLIIQNVPVSYTTEYAAIKLANTRGCIITGNMLFNNFFGIYLSRSSLCRVSKNIIIGTNTEEASSGNAIHLWDSDYNIIEYNILSGHRDGIYLEFVNNCIIEYNYSQSNIRYGLHFMYSDTNFYYKNIFNRNGAGVAVMYSRYIIMAANIFVNNQSVNSYGLLLKEIFDSELFGNTIRNNTYGIFAEGITRIKIEGNDIESNGWAMKILGSCTDNIIRRNNFEGNSFDITTNASASANVFVENYWDRYTGYDLDGDNIGDIPYRPVKLFSFITAKAQESLVLINSVFVDLLNFGESISPVLTPKTLSDPKPMMNRIL